MGLETDGVGRGVTGRLLSFTLLAGRALTLCVSTRFTFVRGTLVLPFVLTLDLFAFTARFALALRLPFAFRLLFAFVLPLVFALSFFGLVRFGLLSFELVFAFALAF